MKTKTLVLYFILNFLSIVAICQDPTSSVNYNICSGSMEICGSGVVNITNNPNFCLNGVTKIYRHFSPLADFVSNLGQSGGGYSIGYILNGQGNSLSSTYKVYGPFNAEDNVCDMINSFQAPINDESTGTVSGSVILAGTYLEAKTYIIEISVNSCLPVFQYTMLATNYSPGGSVRYMDCHIDEVPCENCLPKFQPSNGQYVVSAWVKQENPPAGTTSYTIPKIKVVAGPAPNNLIGPVVTQTLEPSGRIIDGWQKIEEIIFVTDETSFEMKLQADGAANVLFDDIRVYPNDGSAITYVYDPITQRLMAELDERNFATLYEYDEEGKLVRVKKETEKGIMTIQENRDNNSLK